ncbi:MAG: exodeoxyribonuclease VII large subunit [Desulfitobacteriaceae bacterium]|nr:exodeoxyribonuclease VII large subunit [Desulfitobacteriaceae bacterium]
MVNKKVFSVSELNAYLKGLIENDRSLKNLWIKGEISNFKAHSSGHRYFVLKDAVSSVRCVMFRSRALRMTFQAQSGMDVILRGYISVYERDGQYQVYVEEIYPAGMGALYLAFEQLKTKLEEEGLFDEGRKREIPFLPRKIGVVTSGDGAAWQDIQKVVFKRFPSAHLVLVPTIVQGDNAPREIVRGIQLLNKAAQVDVIIVGRGGGSLEELWAFNTEIVARAVYSSRMPIISAVGHQTDYTICDFVADKRAATPSQAGEMVVPVQSDLKRLIKIYQTRLQKSVNSKLDLVRQQTAYLRNSAPFVFPERLLRDRMQDLDIEKQNLERNAKGSLREFGNQLAFLTDKINMLSPFTTLARGYAVCRREKDNKVITASREVNEGEKVEVILAQGRLLCRVADNKEGEPGNGRRNRFEF